MEPGQVSRAMRTRPPGPQAANGTAARPNYRPARAVPTGAAPQGMLDLQAAAGNRAVAVLVARMAAVQRADPDPARATGHADEVIEAAVAMATSGATLLLADDIRTALAGRASDTELAAEFDAALGRIEWGAPEEGPIAPLTVAAGDLVRLLERRFILDPKRSTLDLLGPRRSARYRAFAWDTADFPGGPTGPNEGRAKDMIGALGRVRPERRANSTEDAVVVESEVNRTLERQIRAQQVIVEGQGRNRLHPDAAASFVRMHAAAAAEGVDLHILNSDRSFKRSRSRAAKVGQPTAIAGFSTHNLGLAVDLRMSSRGKRFRETRTSPFGKLVQMHEAPAHKWMFLRGEAYGWYPYSHEPWHWEYNPSGFRATYREALGMPADDPAPEAEAAPAEDG